MVNKSIKYLLLTTGAVAALLIGLFASSINAATLTIEQGYTGWTDSISLNFNGNIMASQAGENQAYFNSNTSYIAPAYCVDLSNAMFRGENTVDDMVSPSSYSANGIYVEWLMANFSGAGKSATTALQLAIWEVLYDFNVDDPTTGYNLDTSNNQNGNFSYNELPVTTNVAWINGWYDTYISALITELEDGSLNYTSSGDYVIAKLSNGSTDTQDVITYNPVPEPATMILFGFGLLGISAIGRKKS